MKKSIDELGDKLCDYCDIDDNLKGVRSFGGEPSFCVDSGLCESAYQNYLESEDEE